VSRLRIEKTLKHYVGGKFIRSESGHTMAIEDSGRVVHVAKGSRKDLRDAVRIARKAQPGWAARTAYNRGQILYRLAEMLDGRLEALPPGSEAAIDRAVHHAGWADKITALLSSLNPVAGTYVNYSRIRPMGVLVAAPDAADGLLGQVEAACACAVMGNTAILVIDAADAIAAAALAEALATSDFPGGVINVLCGDQDDLLRHAAAHDDLDGITLAGDAGSAVRTELETQGARVMRRLVALPGAQTPAAPHHLQHLAEVQTVWMSAYEPRGGAAAY